MRRAIRRGTYYRVFKPKWSDPLDTAYSKRFGGRWNAPAAFGALYLNATIEVAAANARMQHRGRALGLFDLLPSARPSLLQVHIPSSHVLDVVSPHGVRAVRLPATYPFGVTQERCRPIGARAYAMAELRGIACRSSAEAAPTSWLGEEVAWFDRSPRPKENGSRRAFEEWYPDAYPGREHP